MFEELNFGDKFVLRFNKNEDGTYGRTLTLDELQQMQVLIDDAFGPTDEDYLAAMGPCGK